MKGLTRLKNNTFKSEKIFTNLLLVVTLIVCTSFCGYALPEMKVSKNSDEYAEYLQKAWKILELLEPWLPIELDYIKSMDLEFRERYDFGRRDITINCIEATQSIFINFHDKEFVSLSIWNSEYEKNIVEITEDTHIKNLKVANEIIKIFDDSFQFDIEDVRYRNTTSKYDNISEYSSWGAMKFYEYNGIRYDDCFAIVSLYSDGPYVNRLTYIPAKSLPVMHIKYTVTEAQEIAKTSLLSHEYYKVETLDHIVANEIPELCIIDLPLDELYLESTTKDLVIPDGYVKSDLESARLYWKVELHRNTEPFTKYIIFVDVHKGIVLSTDMTL